MLPDNVDDQVTAILVRARLLLQRGWCQHVDAQAPAIGFTFGPNLTRWMPVSYMDAEAARFCTAGAINRSAFDIGLRGLVPEALDRVRNLLSGSVASWNDASRRTHEEVLRVMDRAIARK